MLLTNYTQSIMAKGDHFDLLHRYARCHYIERDGVREMWIDENLDPFTGEWLARRKMIEGGRDDWDRGVDYNHSTFCDLVISGLGGIYYLDGKLTVEPLFDEAQLDYICLDGVMCGDHFITVIYDKTGERYGNGRGLSVLVDGVKRAEADGITKITLNI